MQLKLYSDKFQRELMLNDAKQRHSYKSFWICNIHSLCVSGMNIKIYRAMSSERSKNYTVQMPY